MRIAGGRPRRLVALMQLLLFMFSSSTSLLACAHGSVPLGAEAATGAHHASMVAPLAHHDVARHADAMHAGTTTAGTTTAGMAMAPVHEENAPHDSSPSTGTSCPWVVGCMGLVQFGLDAPWRVTESSMPTLAPVGVTLRQMTASRDVELPPPRA